MKAAADNDILLKGACYALLSAFDAALSGSGSIGILGTAVHVIPKRIRKKQLHGNAEDAVTLFIAFAAKNEVLEPTNEEQEFAAKLEFVAQQKALSLDIGESLLASIAIYRSLHFFLTGDKRAITSLEELLNDEEQLEPLCGRIMCLEQLVSEMFKTENVDDIRSKICSEPKVDIALSMCFSCYSPEGTVTNPATALTSYINDLRRSATRLLAI